MQTSIWCYYSAYWKLLDICKCCRLKASCPEYQKVIAGEK